MKKHVRAITYAPKIPAVRAGTCRQTIREGDKVSAGDEILWHGWEGAPYKTPWNWRLRVTVTEVIPITIHKDMGVYFRAENNRTGWFKWNSARVNRIAKDDFIAPPTGVALRDVLAGLNGSADGDCQIIRW